MGRLGVRRVVRMLPLLPLPLLLRTISTPSAHALCLPPPLLRACICPLRLLLRCHANLRNGAAQLGTAPLTGRLTPAGAFGKTTVTVVEIIARTGAGIVTVTATATVTGAFMLGTVYVIGAGTGIGIAVMANLPACVAGLRSGITVVKPPAFVAGPLSGMICTVAKHPSRIVTVPCRRNAGSRRRRKPGIWQR